MKRIWSLKYLIIGLIGLGLVSGAYFYWILGNKDSLDQYLTEAVQQGSIRRTVSSTGTLQAVITVQVGSQVSGRIQELHADFNSVVKKGQTLAVIDPANFKAQLERAGAGLATAKATVKNAGSILINRQAELSSSEANLEVARVTKKEAERQFGRDQGLFQDKLISEREVESSQATFAQSTARLQQAGAQIKQAEAMILSAMAQQEQATASVKQARAELRMAEVNLRYTTITSPIDGVVVERNVDIGQTVAASFQAPVLFLIANDLSKMQVIAQIDEADIGTISEKAKIDFTVDAFPGQTFKGKISEIRLSSKLPASSAAAGTGGGATNVVIYNVIIDVDNPQLKLRPAMTANVTFTVASIEDTLKVPNVTLRYRPAGISDEELRELLSSPPQPAATSARELGALQASAKNPDKLEDRAQGGNELAGSDKQQAGRRPWGRRPGDRRSTTAQIEPVIGPSTIERYGIKAGPKIRFPESEDPEPTPAILWVLDNNNLPQPRRVKLGITDGRETSVLAGELKEHDRVITWEISETEQQQHASPFSGLFGPRRGSRTSTGGRTSSTRRGSR